MQIEHKQIVVNFDIFIKFFNIKGQCNILKACPMLKGKHQQHEIGNDDPCFKDFSNFIVNSADFCITLLVLKARTPKNATKSSLILLNL